jgi:hypothetical protein
MSSEYIKISFECEMGNRKMEEVIEKLKNDIPQFPVLRCWDQGSYYSFVVRGTESDMQIIKQLSYVKNVKKTAVFTCKV